MHYVQQLTLASAVCICNCHISLCCVCIAICGFCLFSCHFKCVLQNIAKKKKNNSMLPVPTVFLHLKVSKLLPKLVQLCNQSGFISHRGTFWHCHTPKDVTVYCFLLPVLEEFCQHRQSTPSISHKAIHQCSGLPPRYNWLYVFFWQLHISWEYSMSLNSVAPRRS